MLPERLLQGLVALMLAVVAGLGSATGSEVFTVGEAEHPWQAFGTTPGGVIAFVDHLDAVRQATGELIFPQTSDTLRDWILPLRLQPDFNISRGVIARGGSIDVPNLDPTQKSQSELEGVLNGDHLVAFDRKLVAGRVVRNNGLRLLIDLGARFGVNRIVFYPRMSAQYPFGNEYLRAYEIYLNDGLLQNLFASGQPIFTSPVKREENNRNAVVEVLLEPQFVRFLELRSITTVGFEIDEIEIYGTGFVPTATYVSRVLDLGEPVVWGRMGWVEQVAGAPRDSGVEVRVRSGRDPTPDIYYRIVPLGGGKSELTPFTSEGDTLTQEYYEKRLRQNEQGPIKVDAENWSQWQLVANGEPLALPAPRRYLQFRLDFDNHTLASGRALDRVWFEFGQPPVDRLVAELAPSHAEMGVPTTFTYAVRIFNETGRSGFTRFEIETPSQVAAVHSVEVWDRRGNRLDRAEFGGSLEDLPIRAGAFAIEAVADDHFALRLPLLAAHGTLLKVVFDAAVFRYGTRFQGRAFAEAEAALPLLTEGGDATPEFDTDDLLVQVAMSSQIAGPLRVEPSVITPNGDGLNDLAAITYVIFHLLAPSPVAVEICDLAGRRVRLLERGEVENGQYRRRWDGRDDRGQRVPPGLYLVKVKIASDRTTESRVQPVGVAY